MGDLINTTSVHGYCFFKLLFPVGCMVNPLPTTDTHMRHGLSISQWDGGFNTRRYALVHGFCFFKLFLMVGKVLKNSLGHIKRGYWLTQPLTAIPRDGGLV